MIVRAAAVLALLFSACQSSPAKTAALSPPTGVMPRAAIVVVSANGQQFPVHVEVAADNQSREEGLMYRRAMGADDGMLFVFDGEREQTFWMKNTLIPLDMAFIRTDGTIVGVVPEATPQTETPRTVGVPSRYVLEMNGGWFARKGVRPGDRVLLNDAVPRK
jgi:uncharacterized membrane protein (UPF0127 family)